MSAALEPSDSDSEVDILSDPEISECGYSSVKETEQLRSPEDDSKLNNNNKVIIVVLY